MSAVLLRPMPTPEQRARENIDRQLAAAGWAVQRYRELYLHAGPLPQW